MTTPVHSLYRFFDAADALLYVGRTVDARSRFRAHERDKSWFDQVAKVTREVLPNAAALDRAERQAIQSEKPRHNIHHNGSGDRVVQPRRARWDDVDDRKLSRWVALFDDGGTVRVPKDCKDPQIDAGCDCSQCVDLVLAEIDRILDKHQWDTWLCDGVKKLAEEYLAGADAVDWLYDLWDAEMFRGMYLADRSATRPAPAFGCIEDSILIIDCPICQSLHQHALSHGAAIGPLTSVCHAGSGRYVPVFDFLQATDDVVGWYEAVAA